MTPRQLFAYLDLAYRRRTGWLLEEMQVARTAQADSKGYRKAVKKMRDESA